MSVVWDIIGTSWLRKCTSPCAKGFGQSCQNLYYWASTKHNGPEMGNCLGRQLYPRGLPAAHDREGYTRVRTTILTFCDRHYPISLHHNNVRDTSLCKRLSWKGATTWQLDIADSVDLPTYSPINVAIYSASLSAGLVLVILNGQQTTADQEQIRPVYGKRF
jgi:hypothetical protein